MPINKDAFKRYRIIDKCLSDPHKDYTTDEILMLVKRECGDISIRMIQKDIIAIQEELHKKIIRNAGGRGTVKYAENVDPIFYEELTFDEEEVLRETLRSLGQFDGLDNFTWMDKLKKKLELETSNDQQPLICFSKNEGLQIPPTLLGRLFTAISRKKVIRITYKTFGGKPKNHLIYPYQLKQFNDRWFLIANVVGNEEFPYNPDFIANFALDRIDEKFDYVEDEPYIENPVDLKSRFDEVIGVTILKDTEPEDIVFAVRPKSLSYVQTKYIHFTQLPVEGDWEKELHEQYPMLSDCKFFSISCKPNFELYSRFASYGDQVILLEPTYMRDHMAKMIAQAAQNYTSLSE